jgi:hypothetical protein
LVILFEVSNQTSPSTGLRGAIEEESTEFLVTYCNEPLLSISLNSCAKEHNERIEKETKIVNLKIIKNKIKNPNERI